MSSVPRDDTFDATLALLSDAYRFISNRCRRYESDIFQTRLMLQKVICMMGEEAAEVFYEPDRFTRKKAMPKTALKLLQDEGSVQVMEGTAHHHRKRMFMELMEEARFESLVDEMEDQWRDYIRKWMKQDRVVLHGEVEEILSRAVCTWAGIPLEKGEVEQRTREFGAMIGGAGAIGPRNWWGMVLRSRTERWLRQIIREVRFGDRDIEEGRATSVVAWHEDLDGKLLDVEVAAVELLNILRPTVAVATFVTFSALALHQYPECREKLEAGEDDEFAGWFVQEVRRFYPFFPLIGGRVLEPFNWRGHRFPRGEWVLLDIYGTNHDDRIWNEPEEFRPERFRDWDGSAYNFLPQGGGDYYSNHRCAGEWLTISLMKRAVRLLTESIEYDVPAQDLRIDRSRMPAIPRSGFVISGVGRVE